MAYQDLYRLSVHAVILNEQDQVLMLRTTYGAKDWTLPGGAMDPGETIHETLLRECQEELGCDVRIDYLSGVYYHKLHNSQAFVFRCTLGRDAKLKLSSEHSEAEYRSVADLKDSHREKIQDCLKFERNVFTNKF